MCVCTWLGVKLSLLLSVFWWRHQEYLPKIVDGVVVVVVVVLLVSETTNITRCTKGANGKYFWQVRDTLK